jgi:hypothetical protein
MVALTFGGTRAAYSPSMAFGSVATAQPLLTFGGAPQAPDSGTIQMFSGGGSFGSSYKPVQNSGGIAGGVSNFLNSFSFGSPVQSSVAGGRGSDPRAMGGGFQARQDAVTRTAQLDGSTGFISNLRDQLGGLLANMGSTGDAAPVAQPVAFGGSARGMDWQVIAGLVAVGGLAVYAYNAR